MITILKPGLMTTIQDLGRYGYQKYGVIASGAMDSFAHRLANILVGNKENTPTIEITLVGPRLRFEQETIISLCGGDLSPQINKENVQLGRPLLVEKGSILEFGKVNNGCRVYLAIHGGFNIPKVMGSTSTYLRASIGGYQGRMLKAGDKIETNISREQGINKQAFLKHTWSMSSKLFHKPVGKKVVRVIKGRQFDVFKEESKQAFFSKAFTVSNQSDRMGYRLNGTVLEFDVFKDIISEAVSYGSIQVPAEGNPIVLLADRQTIGGYPKIGQIASVDFSIVAQAKPGESIYFEEISHEEAQRLLLIQEEQIKYLKQGVQLKLI